MIRMICVGFSHVSMKMKPAVLAIIKGADIPIKHHNFNKEV